MIKPAPRSPRGPVRRWCPTPSSLLAGTALFIVLGGSAAAATGLIHAANIAPGAITSKAIRAGAIEPKDLSSSTRALFVSSPGAKGDAGLYGPPGASGVNGGNGTNGAAGTNGTNGIAGTNGVTGPTGADGTNGTITPLSAKQGVTALPTGAPPTTVVELGLPAGNYVVFAKSELSQTGAGDSVECLLKSGATTIDQGGMKTLPALAAVPVSLQGVISAPTPTLLTLQCSVAVANGSANFSSLIAIPTA